MENDPRRLVASDIPRKVGKAYTPKKHSIGRHLFSGREELIEPQPHFIVREATQQEYFNAWPGERLDRSVDWDKMYFYEVQTD